MCAISGVLVMSLPIPIIAGNFEKFHKTQAKKNKLLKRRAAVALARENEEKVAASVFCSFVNDIFIKLMDILKSLRLVSHLKRKVLFAMIECFTRKSFQANIARRKLQPLLNSKEVTQYS